MEPNTPAEEAKPAPAAPTNQVMDVVAPPPVETETAEGNQPAGASAGDKQTEVGQPSDAVAQEVADQKEISSQKAPKPPKNGVGLAIVATVLIVLGLAALATYAYLQTAK
jgi:hypothetical protein